MVIISIYTIHRNYNPYITVIFSLPLLLTLPFPTKEGRGGTGQGERDYDRNREARDRFALQL
jgi:hypothetical protein